MFSLDGYAIDKNGERWQSGLKYCYEKKVKPLCLCKPDGVEMYIAKVGSKYVVKRMPKTGASHHPECESFEVPDELTGKGVLKDNAIDKNVETGDVNLKIDFSLSKLNTPRVASAPSGEKKDTVVSDPKKFSLGALMHYLYEEAGLNRWSPKMYGKRNWGVIEYHLNKITKKITAKHNPLAEKLFIPKKFVLDKKDDLNSEAKRFFNRFRPDKAKKPIGIVLGEVKRFSQTQYGHKLQLKHLPSKAFFFGDDLQKKITKNFASELAWHEQDESIHLLCILTFYLSASGNPQVDNLSLMLVNKDWLPFENDEEKSLIDHLVDKNKHFVKCLRYAKDKGDVMASIILSSANKDSRAVFIAKTPSDDELIEVVEKVSKETGVNGIIWDVEMDGYGFLENLTQD